MSITRRIKQACRQTAQDFKLIEVAMAKAAILQTPESSFPQKPTSANLRKTAKAHNGF